MVSLSTSISLKTLSNPKDTKATQKTKKSKKTKQKRAAATTTTTTSSSSYSSTALVYNNLADQKLQGSRTSFQAREREREEKKEREIQGKHSCNHTHLLRV
jgi:hypothetical protein